MPELPEVHTTSTILNDLLPGLSICDVWTDYGGVFHAGKANIKDAAYFDRFKKEIVGSTIESVSRRGKNVLIHLSNNTTILVHMKMTGHLLYGTYIHTPDGWAAQEPETLKDPYNRFIHLVFTLSNGKCLALSDARKFAKVTLGNTRVLEIHPDLRHLGPEPVHQDFPFSIFKERLAKRPRGKIKTVLMDQRIIAGVGNIYSDEALWRAGVHPGSRTASIPEPKLKDIHSAIRTILAKGIDFGGDSTSDYRNPHGVPGQFHYHHRAYRNTGKPCEKRGCRGKIERLIIGGRSSHFCNTHQKLFH